MASRGDSKRRLVVGRLMVLMFSAAVGVGVCACVGLRKRKRLNLWASAVDDIFYAISGKWQMAAIIQPYLPFVLS